MNGPQGALSPGYRHCLEASPGDVINPGSTIEAKTGKTPREEDFSSSPSYSTTLGAPDFSIVVTTIPNSEGALKKIIRRLRIITEWDCNYGMGEPGPREGRGAGVGKLRIASGAGTENRLFPAKRRWGG